MKKICIYGLGAIGGLLAGRLARAGYQVSAIARGETLAQVRSQGLQIDTAAESYRTSITVTDQPCVRARHSFTAIEFLASVSNDSFDFWLRSSWKPGVTCL